MAKPRVPILGEITPTQLTYLLGLGNRGDTTRPDIARPGCFALRSHGGSCTLFIDSDHHAIWHWLSADELEFEFVGGVTPKTPAFCLP